VHRPVPIVVLCLVVMASVGCPPRTTRTTSPKNGAETKSGEAQAVILPVPDGAGVPARRVGGVHAGVVLSLPVGWTARPVEGEGPVTAMAFGPPTTGVELELRTWDGNSDSLGSLTAGDPLAWVAQGPYAEIAGADGEPLVATFREGDRRESSRDRIGLAWFFFVAGRGVGVIARVPVTRLEAGFHAAWDVVMTARAPGDDT